MTVAHYKKSDMGETECTCGGEYVGLPKDWECNWITIYLSNNPKATLADVVKSRKFKMQESHYHYIVVELANGIKHGMLFCDKKCVADTWSRLEPVEIE